MIESQDVPADAAIRRFGLLRVQAHHSGQTIVCTIDNPDRLNALSVGVVDGFHELLDELEQSTDARVLIITGVGRAFMAGGDISEFPLGVARPTRRYVWRAVSLYQRIIQSPQIVIAAVNGLALGGGAELALYSDLVVASQSARFGFPEATLGVVPGLALGRLAKVVGPFRAKELMLTGQPIDVEQAHRIGLINLVVDDGEALNSALRMAKSILKQGPIACEVIKSAVEQSINGEDVRAMHAAMLQVMGTGETKHGTESFSRKERVNFDLEGDC